MVGKDVVMTMLAQDSPSVFYGGWTTIDEIENNESHVSILRQHARGTFEDEEDKEEEEEEEEEEAKEEWGMGIIEQII